MVAVSIVIITKSKGGIIAGCIAKAKQITDDVVVINNGIIPEDIGAKPTADYKLYNEKWDGYGANKNKGIAAAKYNWILSIDADEIPDDELISSLHQLNYDDPTVVYDIKFRSYFGKKAIRHGSWGRDHHIRLFNRTMVRWSETMVHETLVLSPVINIKKIEKGHLHHYSVKDVNEYESKSTYYAKLSAKKYFNSGKRASNTKLYLSPIFGFFKSYLLYFGFLDGREGWNIAKITVKSTRLKYRLLNSLETRQHKSQAVEDRFVMEY